MVHTGYNPARVVPSVLIAVFASNAALDLGANVAHATALGASQQNLALSVAGVTFVVPFLVMKAGSLDQRRGITLSSLMSLLVRRVPGKTDAWRRKGLGEA